MKVSWFSAGVSSAVATKLARPDKIIYIHIDDQHPDTMRFVKDCEKWFGKEIEILQSPYKNVDTACRQAGWITGVGFSPCTKFLKKRVRKEWEINNYGRHTYIWGFDCNERNRVDKLIQAEPNYDHQFPLLDMTKEDCHGLLKDAGIARPKMYDMGYPNNNCVGCVRGGMGYWNKTREDFPEVFYGRSKLERLIGHSCIKDCFLDELPKGAGRCEPILDECGIMCEIKKGEMYV